MQDPTFPPDPNSVGVGPSQNEKLMAAIAHLSILLPHFGALVPLVLWLANQNSAPFAAYQAKQAFFFHVVTVVLFWLMLFVASIMGLFTFGIGLLAFIPLLTMWYGLADIYGIVGAIIAAQGRDFRYIVIGSIAEPD